MRTTRNNEKEKAEINSFYIHQGKKVEELINQTNVDNILDSIAVLRLQSLKSKKKCITTIDKQIPYIREMWHALRKANLSPPTSSAPSKSESTPSTEPSAMWHILFDSPSGLEPSLPDSSETSSHSLFSEGKSLSNEIKTFKRFPCKRNYIPETEKKSEYDENINSSEDSEKYHEDFCDDCYDRYKQEAQLFKKCFENCITCILPFEEDVMNICLQCTYASCKGDSSVLAIIPKGAIQKRRHRQKKPERSVRNVYQ